MPCSKIITDSEIEAIYHDSHNNNISFVKNECRDAENSKYVFISVKKDNVDILDKPIIWDYKESSMLFKNIPHGGYGKIAKYEQIEINSKFRDEKLATKFDKEAILIYQRNNFKEIQITAIKEGVFVWPKLFYEFVNPKDILKLITEFERYLFEVHSELTTTQRITVMNGIKTIDKIPKNYSKPNNGKISFTDWLAEKTKVNKISFLFKLYKEL
jgi:hypothetical protein